MNMQQPAVMSGFLSHRSHSEAVATLAPRATARLLEYAPGYYVALPTHTTLELIEHPAIIAVPGAAYYGCGLLAWQGCHLPVINVDTLLRAYQETPALGPPRYALVVAYQRAPGNPLEHGALALTALPETVEVGDDAWCALPADSDIWPLLSLSCVQHARLAVPILDTARLFRSYHG